MVSLLIASEAAPVAIFVGVCVGQLRDGKKFPVLGAVEGKAVSGPGSLVVPGIWCMRLKSWDCGNLQGVCKNDNQLALRLRVEPVMTVME
jgi:hypothetical protein